MKLREFLKTLPVVGSAFFVPTTQAKPVVKLINKEPPIEKIVEIIRDGIKYRMLATDQLLITYPDGCVDINAYGDFIKVIGKAWDNSVDDNAAWRKSVRVEGNIFEKKDFSTKWESEFSLVFEKLQKEYANTQTQNTPGNSQPPTQP